MKHTEQFNDIKFESTLAYDCWCDLINEEKVPYIAYWDGVEELKAKMKYELDGLNEEERTEIEDYISELIDDLAEVLKKRDEREEEE